MLGIFKKQVCIFCNYKESHFLLWGQDAAILRETQVVGAGIRNNCVCPQCNSTDRETLEDFTVNTPEGRHMAFGQSDDVRLYSAKDYMGRLSVSGFSVELFFPKRRWKKFAINFQEKLFIARKFNEKINIVT